MPSGDGRPAKMGTLGKGTRTQHNPADHELEATTGRLRCCAMRPCHFSM